MKKYKKKIGFSPSLPPRSLLRRLPNVQSNHQITSKATQICWQRRSIFDHTKSYKKLSLSLSLSYQDSLDTNI